MYLLNLFPYSPTKAETIYRNADGRPLYEAESPDELALVNAAYSYDCCLLNRSPNHILVSMPSTGSTAEYEILKILPFDSSRKCMSIVVRKTGTQEIMLYTKGADSSIMPVLAPCAHNSPEGMSAIDSLINSTQTNFSHHFFNRFIARANATATGSLCSGGSAYSSHGKAHPKCSRLYRLVGSSSGY